MKITNAQIKTSIKSNCVYMTVNSDRISVGCNTVAQREIVKTWVATNLNITTCREWKSADVYAISFER